MQGMLPAALAATVSLLIAVLSGLGVGSGGLFVIWLTGVYGIGPILARGMNLLFFVFSASAASVVHFYKGRLRPRLVLFLSCFAVVGTLVGTSLSVFLDAALLRKIFGGFLVASGGYALLGRRDREEQRRLRC